MLQILRKKSVSKIIWWFLAIIIILSFGVFGTAYLITGQQKTVYAGRIFNKKVALQDYHKANRDVQIQALMRFGDDYEKIKQYLNLENETWDRIILLQEANQQNIKINDTEIISTISEYPFFIRDGKFDSLLYNDILKFVFKIKARDFEESVRDSLKIKKLFESKTQSVNVTDQEIIDAYKAKNEKIQVSYISITAEQFKSLVKIDETHAQQYFAEHKEEFNLPPSINVDYIFLNFLEGSSDADKEALRQKASSLFQELLANPNLQDMATKNNFKLETTGYISMEEPNLKLGWPYESVVNIFSLSLGQIADPFETEKGIVIAKLTDKKQSVQPEFEQIKNKVIDVLSLQEARKIAFEKAKEHLASLKKIMETVPSATEAVKGLGLEWQQTPSFSKGQYLPKIGVSAEFEEAAFKLTDSNKISDVVTTPMGFYILHLDKYEEASMEAFEKEKQQIADFLKEQKRAKLFTDYLTQLRLKANLESNISNLQKSAQ